MNQDFDRALRDAPSDDEENLSLRQIFDFLWSYRVSILLVALLPVLAALFYIKVTPTRYTARAQLLLEPQTPQPLHDNSSVQSTSFDSPHVESQIALIRSEKIALAVIRKLKLVDDPEFGSPGKQRGSPSEPNQLREVVLAFTNRAEIRRYGVSYAIDISYTSNDPDKAARIANEISEAFVQDQTNTRAEAMRAGSVWLEQRIDTLRRQMNAAALRVQKFKVKRDYRVQDTGETGAPSNPNDASSGPDLQRETLEELESTASTYKRIFESYLQAYTEGLQRQSFPVANARVITLATRPTSASWPRPLLILSFTVLVGFLLGFLQALTRYHLASIKLPQ